MTAFYNEIDPVAAQWLRNLITAGHIAPGVVDERSIEDITPDELLGYTQCHFFAGIGVWSYALRLAGWTDDRRIWTGSAPCQPFSAAGKGAGFADERHLWPAFKHLIAECKPAVVLGEQVASSAVDPWIDLVHADLEALGYAFGSVPFPSAGVGAPHIRDRNYWVAHANRSTSRQGRADVRRGIAGSDAQSRSGLGGSGLSGGMAHSEPQRQHGRGTLGAETGARGGRLAAAGHGHVVGWMADTDGGNASAEREQCGGQQRQQPQDGRSGGVASGGLANADGIRSPGHAGAQSRVLEGAHIVGGGGSDAIRPGPTNGFWRDADWLGCRDGKWRPVMPGTFPLVNGAANRVGRLRAYGNAINAEAARIWIETVMECAQ